ncbi:hypothetical protein BDF19DRAFT_422829 [Syncephalis fuscata]|nr:hypothetical protein BDF19DRAFT_422829 [Syncephalis fuscata]
MPIYYNNEILGDDWQNNATIILGAPLHPLGELDTTTFTLQNLNTNDFNRSIIGINHQLLLDTIIGYIFARNLVMAIKMVIKRPRILSGWLCLISSLSGFSWVICVAMGVLYAALNCRGVMWWLVCGLTISSISNSMIVLQKAYLILFRKRWILIVGIISTLPQVAIFIVTWRVCPVAYHPDRGCTFYYPPYLPWVWMGVEAPSH